MKEKKILMDGADMKRALDRIAHEIIEKNRGSENIVFVGMQRRGIVLAKRLAASIAKVEGKEIPVGTLDATFYRDDYRSPLKQPEIRATDIPFSIQDKTVVLVDDVLYTGRTIRAALDALFDMGRPRTIRLAVLVDRGGRELPIGADFVALSLKTAANEEVAVKVQEIDENEGVALVEIN
ncbi:MAG: bifunctional pyr operon transcriptional regulator/uracil phosphoribosyltransferase PyrR [Fibrobacteres bacterium]|nr:bifunctional pyr operon transcriptional regulator/uracil phosphoribosyltransferase PyrR [Fibrobacterota bacterium]